MKRFARGLWRGLNLEIRRYAESPSGLPSEPRHVLELR